MGAIAITIDLDDAQAMAEAMRLSPSPRLFTSVL